MINLLGQRLTGSFPLASNRQFQQIQQSPYPLRAWLGVILNISAIFSDEKGDFDSERIERESLLAMNPFSEMNIDKSAPASNSARLPMGKHSNSSISGQWLIS
jgi:hypothetical protein